MTTIDEKIKDLTDKQRERFYLKIWERLEDKNWCEKYGIDYPNPDINKVKVIFYEEFIKEKRNLKD